VLVAGASTHPGKFGFVSLHNILASGYEGTGLRTNREGAEVLGVRDRGRRRRPPRRPRPRLRVHAGGGQPRPAPGLRAKGVTAAFIASAGYGEAGEEGRACRAELVALADELGMLLAGPNGQGVVSTPADLCAQIVAPYPPAGRIAVASQSGNFVSSFQNYAVQTGVGVSRAVSAGNAAPVTVPDYLDFYADDDATAVALAYVEGVGDGRTFFERCRPRAATQAARAAEGRGHRRWGQRAAASHTGSLAADDTVFDGMCRRPAITRAPPSRRPSRRRRPSPPSRCRGNRTWSC
jgi:acyl-CoA synthetase (NDP forming)